VLVTKSRFLKQVCVKNVELSVLLTSLFVNESVKVTVI